MKKWSCTELKTFIHEDIDEFMRDGLDIRQATSRVQVEYEKAIKENFLDKLIIYLVLCEEGIKHDFLRKDIMEETLTLLKEVDFSKYDKQLSKIEKEQLKQDIVKMERLISEK